HVMDFDKRIPLTVNFFNLVNGCAAHFAFEGVFDQDMFLALPYMKCISAYSSLLLCTVSVLYVLRLFYYTECKDLDGVLRCARTARASLTTIHSLFVAFGAHLLFEKMFNIREMLIFNSFYNFFIFFITITAHIRVEELTTEIRVLFISDIHEFYRFMLLLYTITGLQLFTFFLIDTYYFTKFSSSIYLAHSRGSLTSLLYLEKQDANCIFFQVYTTCWNV
ncbi:hypothetical protein L9F63_004574, partial [Diploptera punctata]